MGYVSIYKSNDKDTCNLKIFPNVCVLGLSLHCLLKSSGIVVHQKEMGEQDGANISIGLIV